MARPLRRGKGCARRDPSGRASRGRPLVLAGPVQPGQEEYFDREIAPHIDDAQVRYVGEVGGEAKNELLAGADALLMPISWPEPFGMVMIEAMACGTPVIAFGEGSAPEVVRHGVGGMIVRGRRSDGPGSRRARRHRSGGMPRLGGGALRPGWRRLELRGRLQSGDRPSGRRVRQPPRRDDAPDVRRVSVLHGSSFVLSSASGDIDASTPPRVGLLLARHAIRLPLLGRGRRTPAPACSRSRRTTTSRRSSS